MSTLVLLIFKLSLVFCGFRSEESELNMRLFALVQAWMMCMCGCMCAFDVYMYHSDNDNVCTVYVFGRRICIC